MLSTTAWRSACCWRSFSGALPTFGRCCECCGLRGLLPLLPMRARLPASSVSGRCWRSCSRRRASRSGSCHGQASASARCTAASSRARPRSRKRRRARRARRSTRSCSPTTCAGTFRRTATTRRAPTRCSAFVEQVDVVISVHGFGGLRDADDRWTTSLLGGTNRDLAAELAGALSAALPGYRWIADLDVIPRHLRGMHPGESGEPRRRAAACSSSCRRAVRRPGRRPRRADQCACSNGNRCDTSL